MQHVCPWIKHSVVYAIFLAFDVHAVTSHHSFFYFLFFKFMQHVCPLICTQCRNKHLNFIVSFSKVYATYVHMYMFVLWFARSVVTFVLSSILVHHLTLHELRFHTVSNWRHNLHCKSNLAVMQFWASIFIWLIIILSKYYDGIWL